MRVARLSPVGLLAMAACAGPAIEWRTDLRAAMAEAERTQRPLYVLSLFGDLSKKC